MKCLIQMSHSEDRGILFLETVISFRHQRHSVIECIPLPWDISQDAPAFFREGILSISGEWAQNKKIIDTAEGFRNKMVKELPYFHVWFNANGGMGHVIENEKKFPAWFGKVSQMNVVRVKRDLQFISCILEPRRKSLLECAISHQIAGVNPRD
jgi:hypothetical protein